MISSGHVTDTLIITSSCTTVIVEIQLIEIDFEILF